MKIYFISLLIACGFFTNAAAQNIDIFTREYYISGKDTMYYRLLYPKNYDKNKHYPIVLFLHGDGERGNDNERQLYAIPKVLTDSAGRIKYPCFILAPQCPYNRLWAYFPDFPKSLRTTLTATFPAQWTFSLLHELIKNLPINQNKIYITGYSGGGEGTFDFLTRHPDLFAAAVPLCSVSDTGKADLIKQIPIWAFHGDHDEINNVKYSRLMIDAIKRHGGNPNYTEYAGMGHNIINRAYNEPGLFDWLFLQKR
ncbi:carboxylesterase family protein [Flavitalea flava]